MKSHLTKSLSSLPVGSLFYFCDADLQWGVNDLTCFRVTRTGCTNLVTGKRTRITDFRAQAVVAEAEFSKFKAEQTATRLAESAQRCAALDIDADCRDFKSVGVLYEAEGWRVYVSSVGLRSRSVAVTSPDGTHVHTTAEHFRSLQTQYACA